MKYSVKRIGKDKKSEVVLDNVLQGEAFAFCSNHTKHGKCVSEFIPGTTYVEWAKFYPKNSRKMKYFVEIKKNG